MSLETLLEICKQAGLAGIAIVAIWFWIRKDRQVTRLYDRLEAKAEKYLEKYVALSTELNDTIATLTDTLDLELVDDPDPEPNGG